MNHTKYYFDYSRCNIDFEFGTFLSGPVRRLSNYFGFTLGLYRLCFQWDSAFIKSTWTSRRCPMIYIVSFCLRYLCPFYLIIRAIMCHSMILRSSGIGPRFDLWNGCFRRGLVLSLGCFGRRDRLFRSFLNFMCFDSNFDFISDLLFLRLMALSAAVADSALWQRYPPDYDYSCHFTAAECWASTQNNYSQRNNSDWFYSTHSKAKESYIALGFLHYFRLIILFIGKLSCCFGLGASLLGISYLCSSRYLPIGGLVLFGLSCINWMCLIAFALSRARYTFATAFYQAATMLAMPQLPQSPMDAASRRIWTFRYFINYWVCLNCLLPESCSLYRRLDSFSISACGALPSIRVPCYFPNPLYHFIISNTDLISNWTASSYSSYA